MNTLLSNLELNILSLYMADYGVRLHVREIARLLKANHRTVSLALQRLEKNRVMDSGMVGKSKQYYLKLDASVTKEFIKSAESYKSISILSTNFLIKKLMNELLLTLRTTPVFLFGSYAKGTETKESDIDIVIIKDNNEPHITKVLRDFAQRHNKTVQIQNLSKEQFESGVRRKDHLVIEIVKNHIMLNNNEYFIDVLWRYYHER